MSLSDYVVHVIYQKYFRELFTKVYSDYLPMQQLSKKSIQGQTWAHVNQLMHIVKSEFTLKFGKKKKAHKDVEDKHNGHWCANKLKIIPTTLHKPSFSDSCGLNTHTTISRYQMGRYEILHSSTLFYSVFT